MESSSSHPTSPGVCPAAGATGCSGWCTCRERGSSRWGSPEAVRADVRSPPGERITRPTSPEGWSGGLAGISSMGQGLEGLFVTSPGAPTRSFRAMHTPFAARAGERATEVDAASLDKRGRCTCQP